MSNNADTDLLYQYRSYTSNAVLVYIIYKYTGLLAAVGQQINRSLKQVNYMERKTCNAYIRLTSVVKQVLSIHVVNFRDDLIHRNWICR